MNYSKPKSMQATYVYVCMSRTAFVVILHCLPTKYNDVDTHNIKKKENNSDVNVLTKIDSTMDKGFSRSYHINYSPPPNSFSDYLT